MSLQNRRTQMKQGLRTTLAPVLAWCLCAAGLATAGIPEPPAVYWGTVRLDGQFKEATDEVSVVVKDGALVLAEAEWVAVGGSNDPDYYVLEVALESLLGSDPSDPTAAQLGEVPIVYVGSGGQEYETTEFHIGGRGRVTRVDLNSVSGNPYTADHDGDGFPDLNYDEDGLLDFRDNCIGGADHSDGDGDGIGNSCEAMEDQPPLLRTVGDAGNAADPETGKGTVNIVFEITDTEITNIQYRHFLEAVATASDPNGLYNEAMTSDPRGGIVRNGAFGAYTYKVKPMMARKPVNFVSWLDAARYVNWVENGEPTGVQGAGTTETGSFDLSVGDPARYAVPVAGSQHALPTEDEWYKAAYFDPIEGYSDFPVGADSVNIAQANPIGDIHYPGPTVANFASGADWNGLDGNVTTVATAGSTTYYMTYDQGGNVNEWVVDPAEEDITGVPLRVARGGSYASPTSNPLSKQADSQNRDDVLVAPETESAELGFRVVFHATALEPVCNDGIDNDGDGFTDYPDDMGCSSLDDLSEEEDCADGLDNDGDGLADLADVKDCRSSDDPSEAPDCNDGYDNDGDGLFDSEDDGCRNASDYSEEPDCRDGLDNEGDGSIDYDGGLEALGYVAAPFDPQCKNKPNRGKETGGCGLGFELLLIMLGLSFLRRRRV